VITRFEIAGPGLEGSFPLYEVADILATYHQALDKAYLQMVGRKRMSADDRRLFEVRGSDLHHGSPLWMDLLIQAPNLAQGYLAFTSAGGGWIDLASSVATAVEFLRTRLRALGEGRVLELRIDNSPGATIGVSVHGDVMNVGEATYALGTRIESQVARLVSRVDGRMIGEVSARPREDNGMPLVLTPSDNELFNPETRVEEEVVDLVVKLFKLDIRSRSGRLRVLEGDLERDVRFEVMGRGSLHSYVLALEAPRARVKAHREVVDHASGVTTTAAYQVISCEPLAGTADA